MMQPSSTSESLPEPERIVAQERLRGLLRASQALAGDLSLSVVLQRLVDSARDLVGARYGALGILTGDGVLGELITSGMTDEDRSAIAAFPAGLGVLSAATEGPVRVPDIAGHPSSVGFPAGHPPMSAFLGVPIRIRDATFGVLYLTDRLGDGEFTAEDEQLAAALATTAATAIQNARLYEEARRRERSLEVSVEITNNLLLGSGDPLYLIAERSREGVDADIAAVVVPVAAGYRVEAAAGLHGDQYNGLVYPAPDTVTEQAFRTGEPVLLPEPPRTARSLASGLGPFMIVPLRDHDISRSALIFARQAGGRPFSAQDLSTATTFGDHVGLAMHLADAQGDRERLTLLEDRTRIARDLHDNVIQRLFATGLGLQRLADRAGGADADRMAGHIADLDETIRQIRQTIFRLQAADGDNSIRSRILDLCAQAEPLLGFTPSVTVGPAVDASISREQADDVVACVREGLSNVVRHAQARSVRITLGIDRHGLVLDIVDDGVGMTDTGRRSGLANMSARAERAGGTLTLSRPPNGGLHVSWRVEMPPGGP